MYLLEISMQAKAKKQLFKLFTILFKHFYFSCLHEMIKERKVCLRYSWQFILYFQNVDPRVFWSFWYIRQRAVLIYWKEQETLGSRLFYFCINLIITWAPGPVWGLFSDKWWTFAFPKFISNHGSVLHVDKKWFVCAILSCRYIFSIKN